MQYGCIGEHLKHSFSKEIHNALSDYEYELREIPKKGLSDFLNERDFRAINVTIPYKEEVIPHLFYIDDHAATIGAVNTVVNREGKLYGYNTDFYGMKSLLAHAGIEVSNKKVAVLGTGGTSKTARAVARALGAQEIITVSRTEREDAVTYAELLNAHADVQVMINTTPMGMYPHIFGQAVELSAFKYLSGVADAVYNPLRTPLILDAIRRGIPAEGGLYMLVAQAVFASEIFTDTQYDIETTERVFAKLKKEKENIVLIGMPASGKSTVGALLAKELERKYIDTDSMVEQKSGMPIPEIFKTQGESAFRKLESEVVEEVSAMTGMVIATGGGVVLSEKNTRALAENGRLYFIDRPLEALIPTDDRPLSSTKEAITARYTERYSLYKEAADVIIDADCEAVEVAKKITGEFMR